MARFLRARNRTSALFHGLDTGSSRAKLRPFDVDYKLLQEFLPTIFTRYNALPIASPSKGVVAKEFPYDEKLNSMVFIVAMFTATWLLRHRNAELLMFVILPRIVDFKDSHGSA